MRAANLISKPALSESERDFESYVVELAQALRWRVYHSWMSIHSAQGWPDLAMARGKRFIVAELKAEKGKLSRAQEEWLDALREAGLEVYLWRPSHRPEIEATLR